MIIILLAQIQMAFNVNALPVSMGPIVETLDTPATMVGTALVVYSLCVAAFVMLGAKLGKLFGERLVFQITVIIHGLAMGLMAVSPDVRVMIGAQALAGLAAAALVPTLVVLVAANYHSDQQAQALGLLAGAPAMAGVLAFLIAGYLGTAFSWRYSFGHHARPVACGAGTELSPQTGPASEGCQNRFCRRAADRPGYDLDQPGL